MVNSTETASIISQTQVNSTRVNSSTIIWKAKALWFGQTSLVMRASSRLANDTERGHNTFPMEITMSDSGRTICSTGQECSIMLRNRPRGKASGKMERGTRG